MNILEQEKLRLEIKNLERPFYKRIDFWKLAGGVIAFVVTAFFTYNSGILDISRATLENEKILLQKDIVDFEGEKDSLLIVIKSRMNDISVLDTALILKEKAMAEWRADSLEEVDQKRKQSFLLLGDYINQLSKNQKRSISSEINCHPKDFDSFMIANATLYPNSSKNYKNLESFESGDLLAVFFYFHNCKTDTIYNLRAKINYTIYEDHIQLAGVLFADNIAPVLGSAVAFIPSKQNNIPVKLDYVDYLFWEGNQSKVTSKLPDDQHTPLLIQSEGVLIGNLGPGWNDQGSLVLRFRVIV
jgi:hypothetical protein